MVKLSLAPKKSALRMDLSSIHTLVFSGGGLNGAAQIGALIYLERLALVTGFSLRHRLRCARGTSVGALIALLTVLNIPAETMLGLIFPVLHKLVQRPLRLRDIVRGRGLSDLKPLRAHIEEQLHSSLSARCTLADLQRATGTSLEIVVTDLLHGRHVLLTPATHPNACVVDAVLASMSLPAIFRPMRIRGLPSWYADGGLAVNFAFPRQAEGVLGLWLCDAAKLHEPVEPSTVDSDRPPSLLHILRSMQHALLASQENYFGAFVAPDLAGHVMRLTTDHRGFRLNLCSVAHVASLCRRGIWLACVHMLVSGPTTGRGLVLSALASLYPHVLSILLEKANIRMGRMASQRNAS